MAVSEGCLNYVTDQLSEFGPVDIKRMFGGVGIFREGLMFAKIGGDEVVRLKVDDYNQADFEARGMRPFYSEKMKKGLPYWEVPIDILEDKYALKEWATKSFEAALRSKK